VTIIIAHPVFIVRPRYLLCFIHSMLSVMQQIDYDLQIRFDDRPSFAICFFFYISTSVITKGFLPAVIYDWWTERILLFPQICVLLLDEFWVLCWWMPCLFRKLIRSRSQTLIAIFKIAKHVLRRRLMTWFFTSGMKKSIRCIIFIPVLPFDF